MVKSFNIVHDNEGKNVRFHQFQKKGKKKEDQDFKYLIIYKMSHISLYQQTSEVKVLCDFQVIS